MNQFEFELRYLSYQWMNTKFNLGRDQDQILQLIHISDQWKLEKNLTDTTPEELKKLTLDTYTLYKKEFVETYRTKKLWNYTLWEYIDRLEYEYKVILEMWFVTYFLIVQDFINWARDNKIMVGPWRGSAAGSLLAWFVGITDVDPLPYELLFERFLNPARISMPDIDIDFEDTLREQVLEYVKHKYGHENVAHIGTYMKMATKAAFKDVARAKGVPFEKSNLISNLIPDKTTLLQAVQSEEWNEELKGYYNSDEMIRKIMDLWNQLEGTLRQVGVHACGIIIAPGKVTQYTPVQYPLKPTGEQDTTIVSQYDGKCLEDIGLLKMDFLGLRNLSVIKNCIKIIKAKAQKESKELPKMFQDFFETMLFNPPLDDTFTYDKVLQKGDTSGVFQFEWDGIRSFLIKLKPSDINDIVAMGALYRPGPMEFIPSYIARKHWTEEIYYMHPDLQEIIKNLYGNEVVEEEKRKLEEDLSGILSVTYGIAVYQEQLMFLVQKMAGFSFAEADLLRRWIGKKIKEVIDKIKGEFIEKAAVFRNYKPETAQYIYEKMIEPAAFYSFNKSHSVAYGLISYQTAYLKAHYPIEFHAALLRSVEEDTDKFSKFIDEIKMHGYAILPPHINQSFTHVAAVDDKILLWFYCIKGVGYDVSEKIEKERSERWLFKDFEDFLTRCETLLTKKTLESLAKSGAFDHWIDRKTVIWNLNEILDRAKHSPAWDSGLFWGVMKTSLTLKKTYETTQLEKFIIEYDVFKTFVSGHPFDWLYGYLKKFNFFWNIKKTENFGAFRSLWFIKNFQRAKKKGFFMVVEDISDQIEVFLTETLDLEVFDIIILEWWKWKSIRISKIIKTSLDKIINDAKKSEKYNPEETVVQVKFQRLWIEQQLNEIQNQSIIIPLQENNGWNEEDIQEVGEDSEITIDIRDFKLPDTAPKLQQLKELLEQYPGDIHITFSWNVRTVNQEWLRQIQDFYS